MSIYTIHKANKKLPANTLRALAELESPELLEALTTTTEAFSKRVPWRDGSFVASNSSNSSAACCAERVAESNNSTNTVSVPSPLERTLSTRTEDIGIPNTSEISCLISSSFADSPSESSSDCPLDSPSESSSDCPSDSPSESSSDYPSDSPSESSSGCPSDSPSESSS